LEKTLVFCIFLSWGSNIHETVMFDVISRILDASRSCWASWLGRWAIVYFSNIRSFSKIDFPDSLTVGLSLNLDIWFTTCYCVVLSVGSSIRCL